MTFFVVLSLANTGDMISSQACHSFFGAAVQPLNGHGSSCSTIERPRVQLFNQMIADTSAKLSALELDQKV